MNSGVCMEDGFAIGGAVGFRHEMEALLQFILPQLPSDRPNHLLGALNVLTNVHSMHWEANPLYAWETPTIDPDMFCVGIADMKSVDLAVRMKGG